MKKILSLIFLSLLEISYVLAQGAGNVTGRVTDSAEEPLTGVSVSIRGTATGTVADVDGHFGIAAKSSDVLVFKYMGMKTLEIGVAGRSVLNVTMEYADIELEEVVAIGYGTVKRRDLTSAVSSIHARDIENLPVASLSQALGGKIAGVQIVQSQGSPDAEISVRVRGGISITQSNEPLYVIDGFPTPDGMRMIDPSDIESIDVLKDASATAIYGSQGANGVVLITTKSGKEGKSTVNFDMFIGLKKITKELELLNTLDFVRLEYERAMIGSEDEKRKFTNFYGTGWNDGMDPQSNMYSAWQGLSGAYAGRAGVDWQREVFGAETPLTQNYKVSLSGGTKTAKYQASYARTDDDGIMKGSGYTRNNIRLRFDSEVTKKVRFTANVAYIDEATTGLGSLQEAGYFSRMRHIIQYRPIIGRNGNDSDLLTLQNDPLIEDESGNQMQNPLYSIRGEDRERMNRVFSINGDVSYRILKNLTYKGSAGVRSRAAKNDVFYTSVSRQAINAGAPYGEANRTEYYSWSYSNTLTYSMKPAPGHALSVMAGQEDWWQEVRGLTVKSTNFPKDNFGLDDMSLGETPDKPSTSRRESRKISFFGRATYDIHSRYLLSASVRTEGASQFGPDSKWGTFPAVSGAWRLSEEDFIRRMDAFSNLKIRLGYGVSGNNNIQDYLSLSKMESSWMSINNSTPPSYGSSQLPNPKLRWEKDVTINAGLDIGLFRQRIQITADFYRNSAHDLLLKKNLPMLSGYPSTMLNVGKTRNDGVEITLNTQNIRGKDFTWTTDFNISSNKNKVVALAEVDYFTWRSAWAPSAEFNAEDYMIRVGEPLGQMYGHICDGIYTVDDFDYNQNEKKYVPKAGVVHDKSNIPKPGSWKYRDTDGNGEITPDDRTVIGNANPIAYGGMTNTFIYKGIDFSFGIAFQYGNDVYNANKMYYTKMNLRYKNSLAEAAGRFTYIDENGRNVFDTPAELARINQGRNFASTEGSSNLVFHSGYVEDGSFLRFTNITLGYALPKNILRRAGLQRLRIYATAYNLWTITSYSGYDPEVNTRPNGGLTPGIDWGAYPRAFSAVAGCNITF
ncbi:MAG: TonB-dependent receptor [Tannerella sp.]|nr:TonB-dependent receptor [Tannerella sp.]